MNEVRCRQFAAAHCHPRFFEVETWSGYRSSTFDPHGALHLLPKDCSDGALGRAVLDALSRSRFFSAEEVRTNDLFDPDTRDRNYAAHVARLMAANGLKTKRALFKDLDHINLEQAADGTISMQPTHHVKLEAWEGIPDLSNLTIAGDRPPEEIGAALRRAFSLCTHK